MCFFNLRKMSTKLRKGELKERYAFNENPATLGESLLSTKKEGELLNQSAFRYAKQRMAALIERKMDWV